MQGYERDFGEMWMSHMVFPRRIQAKLQLPSKFHFVFAGRDNVCVVQSTSCFCVCCGRMVGTFPRFLHSFFDVSLWLSFFDQYSISWK
jgi:hypothetical protein